MDRATLSHLGPLISIVTPCLNRAGFVARAVESVLRQDYPRYEHIVTDGGSMDGTLALLAGYPHLRVISEPDKNLYDAVNKGIRLARGEVIGFLNTDDYYAPDVFGRVAAAFAADPELDAVYGGSAVVEVARDGTRRELARYCAPHDLALTIERLTSGLFHINARFFHRRVYERVGLYDLRYRIAADLDFALRASRSRLRTVFLPTVVYHYCHHPGSLTFQSGSGIPPRTARDVLAITEGVLDRWSLTGPDRRAVVHMHTAHAIGAAFHCLRQRQVPAAVRFAGRGLLRNPLCAIWVGRAALNVARRMSRQLFARNCRPSEVSIHKVIKS